MPDVKGRCPACGGDSLFLSDDGSVYCSRLDCPAPGEADALLHGKESVFALSRILGGGFAAHFTALKLHAYKCSSADLPNMTDEQLLRLPGIGEGHLARIRAVFPAPTPGEASDAEAQLASLREGLHRFRYALDSRVGRETTTDFMREMLNAILDDPGEPCDRDDQHARAEQAEAAIARVRAELARMRAITPTWEPAADLIDAALDDPGRPREQRMRPARPDGTPYTYSEIAAEDWGFCEGCRMWSTGTPERPHQCSEPRLLGCGFCYEEQGQEIHPHPECPIRAASRAGASVLREQIREAVEPLLSEYPELGKIGTAALNALRVIERYEEAEGPVVGTARIGLNVHTGFTGGISSERLRDGVILPAVSFEDARVLPLQGSPGWGRLVLADNQQSQFTIGQQQYAVSSEHPIVIEPFGPGTAGGLVTLTLVANTVTVNGAEVGDRE